MSKTYYLVHHPDARAASITPRRFDSFSGARFHAFLLSRITHRGVSVTRHPRPFAIPHVFTSTSKGEVRL